MEGIVKLSAVAGVALLIGMGVMWAGSGGLSKGIFSQSSIYPQASAEDELSAALVEEAASMQNMERSRTLCEQNGGYQIWQGKDAVCKRNLHDSESAAAATCKSEGGWLYTDRGMECAVPIPITL